MNEFCRPLSVQVAPRAWLTRAILVLYGLPLPVALWALASPLRWGVGGVALALLLWELYQQRAVGDTLRLHAETTHWRLYRAAQFSGPPTSPAAEYAQEESARVEINESFNFGFAMLLWVAQDRGKLRRVKFRLLILRRAQSPEQWHRLHVLLREAKFNRAPDSRR